jgi:hypothetical protein
MRVPRLCDRLPQVRPQCAALLAVIVAVAAGVDAVRADDGDLAGEFAQPSGYQRVLTDREIGGKVDSFFYARFGGESPQDALDTRLRNKVAELARTAGLSQAQKEKLLLAGAGDIHHLIDQINGIKVKFQTERAELRDLDHLFNELRPFLDVGTHSIFDANSLFAKALAKMLTSEQVARYQRIDRERSLFQHRAGVRMTALRLSTALGLSDEQRQRLEQVLFQETQPTRITGPAFPAAYFLAVYVQINRIPDEHLKSFLEPWQWQGLQRKIAERETYVAMLRSIGVNPQEDQVPVPQAARIMKAH